MKNFSVEKEKIATFFTYEPGKKSAFFEAFWKWVSSKIKDSPTKTWATDLNYFDYLTKLPEDMYHEYLFIGPVLDFFKENKIDWKIDSYGSSITLKALINVGVSHYGS